MQKLYEMSNKELSRYYVIKKLDQKEMNQLEAAQTLGISIRQVRRLLNKYRKQGPTGLVSGHRKMGGNHHLPDKLKSKILRLITETYPGLSLAQTLKNLQKNHDINVSLETLRLWMLQKGIRRVKKRPKQACIHELESSLEENNHPSDCFTPEEY